jgi:hypothetical protein
MLLTLNPSSFMSVWSWVIVNDTTPCDDGSLCTNDSCDSNDGCVYNPIICPQPANNPYEAICSEQTGECLTVLKRPVHGGEKAMYPWWVPAMAVLTSLTILLVLDIYALVVRVQSDQHPQQQQPLVPPQTKTTRRAPASPTMSYERRSSKGRGKTKTRKQSKKSGKYSKLTVAT